MASLIYSSLFRCIFIYIHTYIYTDPRQALHTQSIVKDEFIISPCSRIDLISHWTDIGIYWMFNGTCTATAGVAARLSLSSMSIGLFNIHYASLSRALPSALKSQVLSEARATMLFVITAGIDNRRSFHTCKSVRWTICVRSSTCWRMHVFVLSKG